MAFRRKRRSFGRGGHRARRRFEVSQVSRVATVSIEEGSSSRSGPFPVAIPLITQFGLMRTGDISGAVPQAVMDSSIRGISVARIILETDITWTMSNREPDSPLGKAFIEMGEGIYHDEIVSQPSPIMTVTAPVHIPNWFENEVGDLAIANSQEGGGFGEVFEFPKRVLFRRWGLAQVMSTSGQAIVDFNDTSADATQTRRGTAALAGISQIGSMQYQNPVTWSQRRIKARAFLKDTEGIFYGASIHWHGDVPFTAQINVNAVIAYHVVR